jgi:signal transduction histidine kinase
MNSPIHNDRESQVDFSLVLAASVHDMKNSLGMLLNTLAGMMESAPPMTPEQARTYAVLEYEAARINSELIQLLSLYRMQEKRLMVQIDEHYLIDILEEQLARNDMLFRTRGIKVSLDCDEDLRWYLDGELVGGVINTVLVNCSRYCRQALTISASLDSEGLCIRIADDGAGYPASMLNLPLQDKAGVSFVSGSTNLGLFFAGRVAQLHTAKGVQGRIVLENGGSLGGGVFSLHLP